MPRLKGADFNASVRRDSKGRFTKAGGALSAARSRDRASLADAVLGTAGAGPKRQRESPKFAAAGAALRAAKGGKSTSPAASGGRQAAVEQDVRAAYADAARAPGDWVPLAEIRDRIPGRNRGEVDSALESLAMQPGVQLIPWDNAKALKPRDHEAALHFGGEANHNLRIEDTTTSAAAPSRSLDEGLQQGIGSGNRAGFAFLAAEAERHDREEAARGSKPLQFKGAQLSDEERAAKLREGFERQAAAPKRTDTRGVLSANADTRSAAVQGARSEVAEQRQNEAKTDIRSAVLDLAGGPGEWVGLADLRDKLGTKHSRAEVDQALVGMLDEPDVRIIPVANQKALRKRDWDAAVEIGDTQNHAIMIAKPQMSYEEQERRASALTPYQSVSSHTHAEEVAAAGGDLASFRKAQARQAQAVADVRGETERIGGRGNWVRIADIRDGMTAKGYSRPEVDTALEELGRAKHRDIEVEQEHFQWTLTQRDHDAAVEIGNRPNHYVRLTTSEETAARNSPPKPEKPREDLSGLSMEALHEQLGAERDSGRRQALAAAIARKEAGGGAVKPRPAAAPRTGDPLTDAIGDLSGLPDATERRSGREPLVETLDRLKARTASGEMSREEAAASIAKLSVRYGMNDSGDNAAISSALHGAAERLREPQPKARRPASKAAAAGPSRTPGQQPKTVTAGSARPGDVVEYTRPGDRGARERVRATVTGTSGGRAITLDNGTTMHLSAEPKLISRADPRAQARTDRDEALRQRDDVLQRVADALPNVASREQAHAALSGLTVPELRRLAGVLGATFGAKATKSQLIARLVEIPGRRLDSDAIGRMGRQ